MDWRMDKSSYLLLVLITGTMVFFLMQGAGGGHSIWDYALLVLVGVLAALVLIALSSIPVLIYCYFRQVIPDIDYSIRLAAGITLFGIISEFIF